MLNNKNKILIFSLILISSPSLATDCKGLVSKIAEQLESNYIIEDKAIEMASVLRTTNFLEKCNNQKSQNNVSQLITKELNKVVNDKHLSIVYDPSWVKDIRDYQQSEQNEAYSDIQIGETPVDNYGFKKVEMLAGNIGYVDLRVFADSHLAGDTLENTMKFLKYSDGMIIDLRNNFGGSPFMVNTLASYFFDVETVHLLNIDSRENNQINTIQEWTSSYVPGPRFSNIPLYILTSSNSASAAESFSFAMKNQQRATIIGETTAGAAHPRRTVIIDDNYLMTLPNLRPYDPQTGANWEGIGVTPHIKTSSDKALSIAHAEILNELKDKKSKNQKIHQWAYPLIKARAENKAISTKDLKNIIGQYESGKRKIFSKDGKLFYQYKGDPAYEIELVGKDLLVFKAFDDARLKVVYKKNAVTAIQMLSQNSKPQEFKKRKL